MNAFSSTVARRRHDSHNAITIAATFKSVKCGAWRNELQPWQSCVEGQTVKHLFHFVPCPFGGLWSGLCPSREICPTLFWEHGYTEDHMAAQVFLFFIQFSPVNVMTYDWSSYDRDHQTLCLLTVYRGRLLLITEWEQRWVSDQGLRAILSTLEKKWCSGV